jgi:transcriptional regulator with XRE-family HTH domain
LDETIMTAKGQREVLETVGRRIVQLRQRKKWSRADLARRLGVTRERLAHWERGENTPPLDALIALRRELGVSIDELVTGETVPANGFGSEAKAQVLKHLIAAAKLVR